MSDNANDKVQFTHCCNCGKKLESVVPNTLPGLVHYCGIICYSCVEEDLREEKQQVKQEKLEADLAHAKEVLTCHLCDSCGEVLPVEEFDDWFSCPDCSHDNEPPSWKEEEN